MGAGAQRGKETGPRSHSKLAADQGSAASQAPTSPAPLGTGLHHPGVNTQAKRPLPQHCMTPLFIIRRRGPMPHCPRHPNIPRPRIHPASRHSFEASTAWRSMSNPEGQSIPHWLAESGPPPTGTPPLWAPGGLLPHNKVHAQKFLPHLGPGLRFQQAWNSSLSSTHTPPQPLTWSRQEACCSAWCPEDLVLSRPVQSCPVLSRPVPSCLAISLSRCERDPEQTPSPH